jgi:hypothetical protein
MTVFGTEELNEEIRCTVGDGGVLDKLLGRGQNNAQLRQLLYAIEVAEMLLRCGQGVHRRNPHRLAALLEREIFSEPSGEGELPFTIGSIPLRNSSEPTSEAST